MHSLPIKQFNLLTYDTLRAVRGNIENCKHQQHIQQVAYSVHQDAMTQVCFTCEAVRTNFRAVE